MRTMQIPVTTDCYETTSLINLAISSFLGAQEAGGGERLGSIASFGSIGWGREGGFGLTGSVRSGSVP